MSAKKIAANRSIAISTETLLILALLFVSLNNNNNSDNIVFAQRPFGISNFGENRNYTFDAIFSV
jgi:hypothetical protein